MEGEVQAFLDSLEIEPAYSRATCLAYASDLHHFLSHLKRTLKRPLELSDFDADQVAQFLKVEKEAGLSSSTLLRRRAALQRFEEYLHQSGAVQKYSLRDNPELLKQALPESKQRRQIACLDAEQIDQMNSLFLENHRPLALRDHAIWAVLLEMALSVSDLVATDLTDLDLRLRRLHLCNSKGEDLWLPLGKAALPLSIYLKDGRPNLNSTPDEPALFISQSGARMSRQSIWQVLRQRGRAAQLPITLTPRLVRHTAALHMARAGRPVAEIQALLGHSNALSTQALLQRLEPL